MAKPEPPPFQPGRFLFAAVVAGCVWLLLQVVLTAIPAAQNANSQRQITSYLAALSSGDAAKARTLFDSAIRANPADPDIYELIGVACRQADRYELAEEYLGRGVLACKNASKPQQAGLYIMLSDCYHHSEKAKPQPLAIDAARKALELDPESPSVLNAYGYLLAENGEQLPEALSKINHALELLKKEPDMPQVRSLSAMVEDSYGWVLFKQGNYKAAVNAIEQAIADVPHDDTDANLIDSEAMSDLYYHQGAVYRALKNPERARRSLQTAITYSPKNKEAQAELDALKAEGAGTSAQPDNTPVKDGKDLKGGPSHASGAAGAINPSPQNNIDSKSAAGRGAAAPGKQP